VVAPVAELEPAVVVAGSEEAVLAVAAEWAVAEVE